MDLEIWILWNHAYHLKMYVDTDVQASGLNCQCFKIQQHFECMKESKMLEERMAHTTCFQ